MRLLSCLLAFLVVHACPAATQPWPADALAAPWGADTAAVAAAAPAGARRLEPPVDFGALVAPLALPRFDFAGERFHVWWQFGRDGTGLRQVLLQRHRGDGERAAFARLRAALAATWGEPAVSCVVGPPGGESRREFWWDGPERGVALVLIDFRGAGVIVEGEPRTDDPTVPWYRRQALEIQNLPRRVLLRLSPPAPDAPLPPECRRAG